MQTRNKRKKRIGIVVSDRMDKSIIVRIDRMTRHPKYKRIIRRSARLMVHDEKNQAKTGDWVAIEETRPLSKNKKWRLVEMLKQAELPVQG